MEHDDVNELICRHRLATILYSKATCNLDPTLVHPLNTKKKYTSQYTGCLLQSKFNLSSEGVYSQEIEEVLCNETPYSTKLQPI